MPYELHVALQKHYAGEDGEVEVPHGSYKLDVLRGGVAYEIQTRSFFKIKPKLEELSAEMPVVVIWPVPKEKTIVRVDPETGEQLSARKSPKKGQPMDLFVELRHIAPLLARDTMSLEIVWTIEREIRTPEESRGRFRKNAALLDRELVQIVQTRHFEAPEDFLMFLPSNLPGEFSVADLAQAAGISKWLAGHVSHAMYQLGTIQRTGKRGNAYLYQAEGLQVDEGCEDGEWLQVRCSSCGLMTMEARPGSSMRWRCGQCRAFEVWPGEQE